MLVVLPFISLLSGYAVARLIKIKKYIFIPLLCLIFIVQFFESFAFLWVKLGLDPRVNSSIWISKHIKPNSTIIIENVPIYQGLPNILLTDVYRGQLKGRQGIYKYQIEVDKLDIDKKLGIPEYAVITNAPETEQFVLKSSKKILLANLSKEGYKQVASFDPDLRFYSYFGDLRNFYYSQIIPYTSIEIYVKKTRPGQNK